MRSKDVYERIVDFCDNSKEVYLYGKGNNGKLMYAFLEDNGIHVAGFIVTKKRKGDAEIQDHSGKVIPVYEKREFLNEGRKSGHVEERIIFSLSERYQSQIHVEDFHEWKCLQLKDYQLNELSRYEFAKLTGKYRRISPLRTLAEKWKEKALRTANTLKCAPFGRKLHPWHMLPKFKKPYVKDIVSVIPELMQGTNGTIVECGCGLCDILGDRTLKGYKRYGFDIDENVIYVASKLHHDIEFTVGSFDKINHLNISVLIAVNFLHALPQDELRRMIHKLLAGNHVQYVIVDEVTGFYEHLHKFTTIFPTGCTVVRTLGPYESSGGVRYLKVFDMTGIQTC